MTRIFATAALLGAVLAGPAWAQTATPMTHHRAPHSIHHAASTAGSGTSEAPRHHHYVAGDHSAEMLNRQELEHIQNGS